MLSELDLKKALLEVYNVQMENFLVNEIMPKVIEKLSLTEETAIEMLKLFIEKGWLKTQSFNTKYFLRPGYVASFPVVISSLGLRYIKGKGDG